MRLVTPGGISNRFRFFVGELPEINEIEPNSERDKPQRIESLPVVVNGQILDGDRDFFRFSRQGRADARLRVQGRKICRYISDAVPGWLDACLTLYDAGGKQLAFVNDFRFDPDPLLSFSIPKDGEYTLEVRDILYRGRPEFVYRLTLGRFPLHDARLSARRAAQHARGPGTARHQPVDELPGSRPTRRPCGRWASAATSRPCNALPFAVGDTPEVREAEPNDTPAQANRVTTPVTINGRIQRSGDVDHFIFTAQAGQVLAMEVLARRLGSPLDSILTLFNAKGDELAENDDARDPFDALITHHADSRLVYTFPAAGDYVLRIKDVQGKGGEEYAYRLVIAPPQPDFALRITPDNPPAGPRARASWFPSTRCGRDFGGEITLSAQNLPPGFVVSDGVIPAGQDQARLTITAPADARQQQRCRPDHCRNRHDRQCAGRPAGDRRRIGDASLQPHAHRAHQGVRGGGPSSADIHAFAGHSPQGDSSPSGEQRSRGRESGAERKHQGRRQPGGRGPAGRRHDQAGDHRGGQGAKLPSR